MLASGQLHVSLTVAVCCPGRIDMPDAAFAHPGGRHPALTEFRPSVGEGAA